jgi:general secretion pathway protein I
MTARRGEAGLSTLEVLVSVAVLGLALAPLLAVQSQIAQTHVRYQEAYSRATLQRNALALLQEMNPMATPRGDIALDSENRLRWTSQPLSSIDRSSDHPVGDGPFDVALYAVDAEIIGPNEAVRVRFNTERLGWVRAESVSGSRGPGLPSDPDPSVAYVPPPPPPTSPLR